MIVTIHQPQYLPWIPYFDKILQSDCFILLDTVQFQKNGMQNRNQIKSASGPVWLTVPVRHDFGQTIRDTQIAEPRALQKHLKTIELNYRKSPFFDEVYALLAPVLCEAHSSLCDVNCAMIERQLQYVGYRGKVCKASSLQASGSGSALVLDLCRAVQATTYISGQGGKAYMDLDAFSAANVAVRFQEYAAGEYPQMFPAAGFVPHLSLIDLLFNVGPESPAVIAQGRHI